MGTPYYDGSRTGDRPRRNPLGDVYAFGISCMSLLNRRPAVAGDTIEQLFYRELHEPVMMAPHPGSGRPESIVSLIDRLCGQESRERRELARGAAGDRRPALKPPDRRAAPVRRAEDG